VKFTGITRSVFIVLLPSDLDYEIPDGIDGYRSAITFATEGSDLQHPPPKRRAARFAFLHSATAEDFIRSWLNPGVGL